MQPKEMIRQIFEFNKTAYANAFTNLNILQEQMEKVMNLYIDQAVGMSDESKKAAREWVSMYGRGLQDYRKLADDNIRKMEAFFRIK